MPSRDIDQAPLQRAPDRAETVLGEMSPVHERIESLAFGHSAAPLLIVGRDQDRAVRDQQDKLREVFEALIRDELERRNMKSGVIKWVVDVVTTRMMQREALNGMSYDNRLFTEPNLAMAPHQSPEEVLAACEAVKYGRSSIAQSRTAQLAYGMASGEYANLTIIGDQRKEHEPDMWQQLSDLVGRDVSDLSHGVYRTEMIGYDNRNLDTAQHIGAIRLLTKRLIDTGEYNTSLKVRETVILDTSPSSGFDQSVVDGILKAARDGVDPASSPELQRVLAGLWERGMDSPIVLARNETIYGASKVIRDLLHQRRLGAASTRQSALL